MKTSGPVKHFVWRACHDLLPTRTNLAQRKIVKHVSCPIYEKEEETLHHIFWECPLASDIWGELDSLYKSGLQRLTILESYGTRLWIHKHQKFKNYVLLYSENFRYEGTLSSMRKSSMKLSYWCCQL